MAKIEIVETERGSILLVEDVPIPVPVNFFYDVSLTVIKLTVENLTASGVDGRGWSAPRWRQALVDAFPRDAQYRKLRDKKYSHEYGPFLSLTDEDAFETLMRYEKSITWMDVSEFQVEEE